MSDNSNYFFCEKCQIRLYKPLCVQWQEQARKAPKLKKHEEKCLDCEQGREIAAELRRTTDDRQQTGTK